MPAILRCLALAALLALPAAAAGAADPPLALGWTDLIPPEVAAAAKKKVKTFYSGSINPTGTAGSSQPAAAPIPEGPWMSKARQQPGAGRPPELVAALDGKRVRIGGYVVPLDFDATTVKEFLLVPFVGACIHVPPPPANQIIHVTSATGIEVAGSFDPVEVTGTLSAKPLSTDLAEAGYSLAAETVEPWTP